MRMTELPSVKRIAMSGWWTQMSPEYLHIESSGMGLVSERLGSSSATKRETIAAPIDTEELKKSWRYCPGHIGRGCRQESVFERKIDESHSHVRRRRDPGRALHGIDRDGPGQDGEEGPQCAGPGQGRQGIRQEQSPSGSGPGLPPDSVWSHQQACRVVTDRGTNPSQHADHKVEGQGHGRRREESGF